MKTIVRYQCEICRKEYEDREWAERCEENGIFDGSKYPVGLMFEYHHNGYVGIFALPSVPEFSPYSKHYGYTHFWACRTDGYPGDSLDEQLCGGDYVYSSDERFAQFISSHIITKEKLDSPEYKRMVKYLKSKGITPSYYDENGNYITLK